MVIVVQPSSILKTVLCERNWGMFLAPVMLYLDTMYLDIICSLTVVMYLLLLSKD